MLIHQSPQFTVHHYVVGPLQTNTYFLVNSSHQHTVIIDPGADGDFLSEEIQRLHLQPQLVFFTHGHSDHVLGALPIFLNFQIPAYLHPADLPLYSQANKSAAFWQTAPADPIIPAQNLITEFTLPYPHQLMHTPGHSPGLTSLYLPDEQLLFSGDLIFPGGDIGRTDFKYSSHPDMLTSLQRLSSLPPATRVFPGHEDVFALSTFNFANYLD